MAPVSGLGRGGRRRTRKVRTQMENRSAAAGRLPSGGRSLSEEVYRRLRADILHGALRPNSALVEVELADRLQVSRTPVRESLQRLAADGLIVSHRRRWIVYEHTKEEVVELYEVRAALESYAARLAATRASDDQIRAIADIRSRATAVELKNEDRVSANEQFHDLVIVAANNSRITDQLQRNRLYYFNTSVAALYTDQDRAKSAGQHGEIIDALQDGDADRAQECAREHVEF